MLSLSISNWGDFYYQNKYCFQAITEYKRILYFYPHHTRRGEMLYRIGKCLREEGKPRQALQYFKLSMAEGYPKAFLSCGVTLLGLGEWGAAESLLSYSTNIPEIRSDARFFHAISLILLGKYQRAKQELKGVLGKDGIEVYARLEKLLHWPSPEKAKILSSLIPGLGQAYAGSGKDALGGAITGFLPLALLVMHWTQGDYITIIIQDFPIFFRYYRGGMIRAAQLVQERREKFSLKTAVLALEKWKSKHSTPEK